MPLSLSPLLCSSSLLVFPLLCYSCLPLSSLFSFPLYSCLILSASLLTSSSFPLFIVYRPFFSFLLSFVFSHIFIGSCSPILLFPFSCLHFPFPFSFLACFPMCYVNVSTFIYLTFAFTFIMVFTLILRSLPMWIFTLFIIVFSSYFLFFLFIFIQSVSTLYTFSLF